MKLDAFIFSKDRPAQLQLLLRSMERFAPGMFRPRILWKASSEAFKEGYSRVAKEDILPCQWTEERLDLKTHWSRIITASNGVQAIFTDDCVFFRAVDFSADDVRSLMTPEVLTFSFRLGLNTVLQDYQTGRYQKCLSDPDRIGPFLRWGWDAHPPQENYGYPFGMDSCLFHTTDLWKWLMPFERLTAFRDWEGRLHSRREEYGAGRPLMASPAKSVVINIPANGMQRDACPSGTRHAYSPSELNERLLAGEIIDLDALDCVADPEKVNSCHQEYPFVFRQR